MQVFIGFTSLNGQFSPALSSQTTAQRDTSPVAQDSPLSRWNCQDYSAMWSDVCCKPVQLYVYEILYIIYIIIIINL